MVKKLKKFNKKQTGIFLLVVGLFALLFGFMEGWGHPFWRGATAGIGFTAALVGLSYLFPQYFD